MSKCVERFIKQLKEGLIPGDYVLCTLYNRETFTGIIGEYNNQMFVYYGNIPNLPGPTKLDVLGITLEEAIKKPEKYAMNRWWIDDRFNSVVKL